MKERWKEYRLGDLIHIKHGYAFKGEYFTEEKTNNILLTPGNFKIGGGFKDDKLKYYNGTIPLDYVLKKSDIIVTMTDLSKMADTLGYSAKIPSNNDKIYLHNQRIGLVALKDNNFDIEFLYWLLRFEAYQKFVAGSATGATVKHTSPNKIYAFKFKAPSKPRTQRKIAKILSAYDDLIENNLKRIKLLEEMAQKTYEEWFIRFKFPEYENAVFDEETGLPEGWRKVKLGNKIKFVKGKKVEELFDDKQERTEKVLLLDALEDGKFKFTKIGKHTQTKRGDIMMLMDGARSSYVFYSEDGIIGSTMAKIVSKQIPPTLLYHFFKEILVWLQINNTGAAIPHANKSFINSIQFVLPTDTILNNWNKMIDVINKEVWNLKDTNQCLKEARDILLPRLMTGMIDVEELGIEL